jgi:hypothetical protein
MLTARTRILALSLLVVSSLQLSAGARRRAVATPVPSDELSIAFVDAGHALLDAGAIAFRPNQGRRGMAVTTRAFGLRIGQPSREARGTATLRAFLETADPRATVRIDGIVLGTAPRVIRHHAPIGIAMRLSLEIEVPPQAPEGALMTTIGWEVSTD